MLSALRSPRQFPCCGVFGLPSWEAEGDEVFSEGYNRDSAEGGILDVAMNQGEDRKEEQRGPIITERWNLAETHPHCQPLEASCMNIK